MHRLIAPLVRVAVPVLAAASAVALGPVAAHASPTDQGTYGVPGGTALFVQTDDVTANSVIAFRRGPDGSLTREATYLTGGRGGVADQAPLDSLASQGSLTYDAGHGLLYAVNAGSDSISVFGVSGDRLQLRQVVPSRGQFPVSVTVHGDLVYVLDAGGTGAIAGYRVAGGRLFAVPGSVASLGLANADPPLFITAPAQIGFDPQGRHVVVTTKANNTIEVWTIDHDGRPVHHVSNPSAGAVPFAFSFDDFGNLVVTEAATSTVSTYTLRPDGHVSALTTSVGDGGTALCWTATARGYVFGANAGSGTLSSYRTGADGSLTLVSAVAASTGAGPIDMTTAEGGRLLYVQDAVAGEVQGFRVHHDGSLTLVTTVTGLPAFDGAGMEGLVAT